MIRVRPFHFSRIAILVIWIGLTAETPVHAATPIIEWSRQFGTSQSDGGVGVVTNGPNSIYISGGTFGDLAGPSFGGFDPFLSNYDASGNQQWVKQLGTSKDDSIGPLSLDGAGNLYSPGTTQGNFAASNAGGGDALLTKFDSAGNLVLSRQFGTSADDSAYRASVVASGDIYIAGVTKGALAGPSNGGQDLFLRKYDATGSVQWTKQFGTSSDEIGVVVSPDDLGNVFVSGTTSGSLDGISQGSHDVFLRKYDTSGNVVWKKQIGTNDFDNVVGTANDGLGDVYIAGQTFGSLAGTNAGSSDVFLAKYDAAGNQLWIRQFGSADFDSPFNVVTDNTGAIYLVGYTRGNLQGSSSGSDDAFVSKFDALGNQLWTLQFGSAAEDDGIGVASDGLGHVYVTGRTFGNLATATFGGADIFIVKIAEVPEPSSLNLLAIVVAGILLHQRR